MYYEASSSQFDLIRFEEESGHYSDCDAGQLENYSMVWMIESRD